LVQSKNYFDLVDWTLEETAGTEPPLTRHLTEEEILGIFAEPLIVPNYPSHTQAVERMVRVVTESATCRVGYHARHRYSAVYRHRGIQVQCTMYLVHYTNKTTVVHT
jgi:hypothetical protein